MQAVRAAIASGLPEWMRDVSRREVRYSFMNRSQHAS